MSGVFQLFRGFMVSGWRNGTECGVVVWERVVGVVGLLACGWGVGRAGVVCASLVAVSVGPSGDMLLYM